MNGTIDLIKKDTTNNTNITSETETSDGSWSRSDIMTLAFGLVTVVLTLFAAWIAWKTLIQEKLKERKKSKSRKRAEQVERAEEVSRRSARENEEAMME